MIAPILRYTRPANDDGLTLAERIAGYLARFPSRPDFTGGGRS